MTKSNDWWANKLGNAAPRPASPPVGPAAPVPYRAPAQAPNVPIQYDTNADQVVTKAQSSKVSDTCPGCYSGNYFAPMGTQRKRCYDCGYPIVQQTSGMGSGSNTGNATPTKQVGQSGGFNISVIGEHMG